jgi:hypothetical protein
MRRKGRDWWVCLGVLGSRASEHLSAGDKRGVKDGESTYTSQHDSELIPIEGSRTVSQSYDPTETIHILMNAVFSAPPTHHMPCLLIHRPYLLKPPQSSCSPILVHYVIANHRSRCIKLGVRGIDMYGKSWFSGPWKHGS